MPGARQARSEARPPRHSSCGSCFSVRRLIKLPRLHALTTSTFSYSICLLYRAPNAARPGAQSLGCSAPGLRVGSSDKPSVGDRHDPSAGGAVSEVSFGASDAISRSREWSCHLISLLADVSTKEWISGSGERVAAIFDATNGSRKRMKKGSFHDRTSREEKAAHDFGTQLMDRGGCSHRR